MTTILVTGAAGFVGSHFARVAHDAGLSVIALDDLSTSSSWPSLPEGIERVRGDVADQYLIGILVADRKISAIVHFAGRIRVEESSREPALYFDQNLTRTIALLDAATSVVSSRPLSFVLSSSAAVYGQPDRTPSKEGIMWYLRTPPIIEQTPLRPISPYGASKLAAEIVLESYARSRGIRWAALRYFNAAGAHPDGSLRERHDPETHLVPLAIDAALGSRPPIVVYGDDYETRDGTCVRDYVHVLDLADAHLAAIAALDRGVDVGPVNLGSERGATVKEVLAEVARAVGRSVPYEVGSRRVGDPPELVASAGLAAEKLGWRSRRGLAEVVSDALRSRRA